MPADVYDDNTESPVKTFNAYSLTAGEYKSSSRIPIRPSPSTSPPEIDDERVSIDTVDGYHVCQ
jgi:hypothetical protein